MSKKKNSNKWLFIAIIITIIILIVLLVVYYAFSNKNKEANSNDIDNLSHSQVQGIKAINEFKSIKEIIEYSSSKYLGEEECNEKGYNYKYNVEFKYNLFENNVSQESFFVAIINRISYFYRYNKNYILNDEKNGINIKVKCNGEETTEIIINGEENYYLKQSNKLSKNNSKTDDYIDLIVNSDEIKDTIKNNWNYEEKNYGSKDSEFNKYNLFWNEGISVRKIQKQVYNIVFDQKYTGSVVGNISVDFDFDKIIEKLGEPSFGDKTSNCIGYKTKELYVFFTKNMGNENEISIYQNKENNNEEFEKILENYIKGESDIKDFMNKLTDLWPNYASYEYSDSYLKICYPDKGIKIEYGEDTENGICIYENYKKSNYIQKLLDSGDVISKLDESLFYELEKARIQEDWNIKYEANNMFSFTENVPYESSIYKFAYKQNLNKEIIKILFISKDENYPNKELKENVNEGFFATDEWFVYSIKQKGIYLYNVITNEKQIVLEGNENFELKKYENGLLYFDEESISLE